MFDIGFQELLFIFLLALIIFGPKKLPELGRTLGKWMTEIRQGIYSAKSQVESEFSEIEKETLQDEKISSDLDAPPEDKSDSKEEEEKA